MFVRASPTLCVTAKSKDPDSAKNSQTNQLEVACPRAQRSGFLTGRSDPKLPAGYACIANPIIKYCTFLHKSSFVAFLLLTRMQHSMYGFFTIKTNASFNAEYSNSDLVGLHLQFNIFKQYFLLS
jgi:hypothetical protein